MNTKPQDIQDILELLDQVFIQESKNVNDAIVKLKACDVSQNQDEKADRTKWRHAMSTAKGHKSMLKRAIGELHALSLSLAEKG